MLIDNLDRPKWSYLNRTVLNNTSSEEKPWLLLPLCERGRATCKIFYNGAALINIHLIMVIGHNSSHVVHNDNGDLMANWYDKLAKKQSEKIFMRECPRWWWKWPFRLLIPLMLTKVQVYIRKETGAKARLRRTNPKTFYV